MATSECKALNLVDAASSPTATRDTRFAIELSYFGYGYIDQADKIADPW